MSRGSRTLSLLVVTFCIVAAAAAQTASVSGTVTDSSGAVIPQAKITAHNLATNATRDTATDSSGSYRVASLAPGFYDVRVEKNGFKTLEYSRVQLTVGQVLGLNPVLAPSATAETVTVHGDEIAPIDLDDAQLGDVVKSQQIDALPMILRDPYQLILLSPGAIQGNSILQGLSVNGSRERNNNFLLDGTDNNDTEIPGLTLPQPGLTALNPDSVQEFRVITSSFLPEFGRNTGAVIDIVSKRGTNDFHGDVYWFGRFDALGARDYFNHQLDSSGQMVRKDPYSHNTFGISAGGPLVHDKTFWFANYDGERFDTTLTNRSIVPTQGPLGFTSGVFFFDNVPIDLSSPENIFGLPLDPTMQAILAKYPAPNGPAVDGARGTLYFPSATHTTGDNADVRVDHNFSRSENLSVRYTFNRFVDPNFDHTDFLPGVGGTGTVQRRQNATLQLTTVIDPRLLNNFRMGANRINFPLTCEGVSTIDSFGLPKDQYGRGVDVPVPGIDGFGCLLIVDRNGSRRFSGTYTIGDDVTWARGQHTFKFGVETRDSYSNNTNGFYSRPTLDFNNFANYGVPAFATGDPGVDSNQTLQDMVWALLGTVGSVTQAQFYDKSYNRTAEDLRGFRQKDFAAFAQDTVKVLPNLTVNYGLRYQFNGVPYEVNNLLSTLFTDPGGQAPFTFTIAGKNHGLPALYKNDWHDFEPRIGIAWDPTREGKMSVRVGYGIFHDRLFGQLLGLTRGNPPFQQVFFQPLFGLPAPTCTYPEVQSVLGFCIGPPLSQFPAGYPPSLPTSTTVNAGTGDLPFIIAPNLRMPYSQSWNFGVQRELPGRMSLELNYVGSKGIHLLRLVDGNPPQPALVAQLEAFCSQPNPFNCTPSTLQFNNLWFGAESFLLPFDAVNNNAFLHAEVFNNASSSVYHALQANLTRRMANGLTFQAAYTWAHAIDNASDPLTPANGNQGFPRNSLDLGAERGNSDFDVRQRLVLNYTWAIPLGRGHDHFSEGVAAGIFGGWEIAGITTFASGLPFDIFSALDTAHTGQQQRADFNPGAAPLPVANPRTQTGPNLGLFSDPAWGSAGNLGRNHFYGPGVNRWDMVLRRNVAFTEKVRMEFRAESYNLFNRVQFGQPGNVIADTGTFGQSTSEVRQPDLTTGARQIQFGVKLSF